MVRKKGYIDVDVYTESIKRINHIYDIFDSIVVMFSGGKDSLVMLHLVMEVAKSRKQKKVDVIFRDEELIPTDVIDFVKRYREHPYISLKYFAVPLKSRKYILGKTTEYIQWDPSREHLRTPPKYAYTLKPGDDHVFDQHSMDAYVSSFYPGKKAFMVGIRTDEGIMRFRSLVGTLSENYINKATPIDGTKPDPSVRLVKPIYDWSENDIFKYLYDNKIKYSKTYDAQILSGGSLRVSTPLHPQAAKVLHKLKTTDPVFYDQVMQLFPECLIQSNYYTDFDKDKLYKMYGNSFSGIRRWIDLSITEPDTYRLAVSRLDQTLRHHKKNPDRYPVDYVFKSFLRGDFKRTILPIPKS